MCFQGTFAIITPALISGAVVERMRFNTYLAFITPFHKLVARSMMGRLAEPAR